MNIEKRKKFFLKNISVSCLVKLKIDYCKILASISSKVDIYSLKLPKE